MSSVKHPTREAVQVALAYIRKELKLGDALVKLQSMGYPITDGHALIKRVQGRAEVRT
jgi:hypothetical protein